MYIYNICLRHYVCYRVSFACYHMSFLPWLVLHSHFVWGQILGDMSSTALPGDRPLAYRAYCECTGQPGSCPYLP